jgi:hypothetical protein
MRIRSITYFFHPEKTQSIIPALAEAARTLKAHFNENGIEVQTIRLATSPYGSWLPEGIAEKIKTIKTLETQAKANGFEYLSIGPAAITDESDVETIPAILRETENVFVTATIADSQTGVSLPAVKRVAQIIDQAKSITPDGFTNLRFAALANVPAGIPFFPSAYHDGGSASFAIAVECADDAVTAFQQAQSLREARSTLLSTLETNAEKIHQIIQNHPGLHNLPFLGFDFSLAPFPKDECSLGKALEILGVPAVGHSGSLAAAAFIADTLDQGNWLRSGFNGLMLPVLEDSILAKRSIEQTLTLKDLLLFSAVCGIGLDTVPLPGDSSQDALYAILLDVAALSTRLKKPLTARLMPVPGLAAGEQTDFNFEYFANGAALAISEAPLQNLMTGSENLILQPRTHYMPDWKTKSN